MQGLVIGASRHRHTVIGVVSQPQIADLTALAALHLESPLIEVRIISDTLDSNVLCILEIEHARTVILLAVVSLCTRGNVNAADDAEYHVLGLSAVENIVKTRLTAVGYGVLIGVGDVDDSCSRPESTVAVISAHAVGGVPGSIAAAIECHCLDCAGG